MNPYLRRDMNNCDECLSLKARGDIPGCCQYHLDLQMKEVEE